MKKIIILCLLVYAGGLSLASAKNKFTSVKLLLLSNQIGIKDGWYSATIKYTNYSTYTNSTYTLNVYVKYNSVVEIDFGNGGSIHTGYNNEGYYYTGGSLIFENDYNGNLIAATTYPLHQPHLCHNQVSLDLCLHGV